MIEEEKTILIAVVFMTLQGSFVFAQAGGMPTVPGFRPEDGSKIM